ncbi:MAG: hypothetical protein H6621_01660 [Halobacteriovoraceae bacterium]|nr:hypothetical protein [Halobacteriovoraceae bacterium]
MKVLSLLCLIGLIFSCKPNQKEESKFSSSSETKNIEDDSEKIIFSCEQSEEDVKPLRFERKKLTFQLNTQITLIGASSVDQALAICETSNLNICDEIIDSAKKLEDLKKQIASLESSIGECRDSSKVALNVVFLRSEDETLTDDHLADATLLLSELNSQLNDNGEQIVEFKLTGVKEVLDTEHYKTSCNAIIQLSAIHSTDDALTFVITDYLSGGCLGVSFLWTFPDTSHNILLGRYDAIKSDQNIVLGHELGHVFGLNHTAAVYSGSTPGVGLFNFNDILSGGIAKDRRCAEDFDYYIHDKALSTDAEAGGIVWNSYENLMYPIAAKDREVVSLFTEGYSEAVNKAVSCWNGFALK